LFFDVIHGIILDLDVFLQSTDIRDKHSFLADPQIADVETVDWACHAFLLFEVEVDRGCTASNTGGPGNCIGSLLGALLDGS
jgi:hypothetical protein